MKSKLGSGETWYVFVGITVSALIVLAMTTAVYLSWK
jgi:hypothetical protein